MKCFKYLPTFFSSVLSSNYIFAYLYLTFLSDLSKRPFNELNGNVFSGKAKYVSIIALQYEKNSMPLISTVRHDIFLLGVSSIKIPFIIISDLRTVTAHEKN